MQKIKIGDTVKITAGKDKNQTGKVELVLPKTREVVVAGKNLYKKHVKPQGQNKPGGIIERPRPLSFAKVVIICPKCNKPTRSGFKVGKDSKHRICRKCQQLI
jgi:large subunit ribosomal protein L24